jgi:type VI secretion system secreted protein VgrG
MVEAPTIVLKAGSSKITMTSSGITIKGAKVLVKADGNITLDAGSGVKVKGGTIGEN